MNNKRKIEDAKRVDLTGIYSRVVNKKGNRVWNLDKVTQFHFDKFGNSIANDFRGNYRSNISFVMEAEGLDFISAVNFLLEKVGINPDIYYDKEIWKKTQQKAKSKKETPILIEKDKELKEMMDKKMKEYEKKIERANKFIKVFSKGNEIKNEIINYDKILKENRIGDNKGSFFYLTVIRGIDKGIFKYLYDNGYLMRGTLGIKGRETYDISWNKGIKYDKSGTYFIYKNPLTKEITGMTARSNQDKTKINKNFKGCKWGFGISKGKIEKITIFEAPIDLLSYLTIFKGEDKLNNNYLFATGGTNRKMIKNNLEQLKDVKEIVVATDNDEAGEKFYNIIKETYKNDYIISREKSKNKDWNDDLIK